MAGIYHKTPVGDNSSELVPEAFKRTSMIITDSYYTSSVLLNIRAQLLLLFFPAYLYRTAYPSQILKTHELAHHISVISMME